MGKKRDTYRPNDPECWEDYRLSMPILDYNGAMKRLHRRERRRARLRRYFVRLLYLAGIVLAFWLLKQERPPSVRPYMTKAAAYGDKKAINEPEHECRRNETRSRPGE